MHSPDAEWQMETLLQHLGEEEKSHGSVAPPLHLTSTFVFESVNDWSVSNEDLLHGSCAYTRINNPTVRMAEQKIAAMEGTDYCKLFSSGMAAISAAILSCIKTGDHIIAVDTIYGPTKTFLASWLPRFGVTHSYVSGVDMGELEAAATENTTLLLLESPSSITFLLQDLEAIATWAKARGIATMIDNSYASPWLQQPAKFGIDIVCHSATKYIGGHSDVVAGALCCSAERMQKLMIDEVSLLGASIHPFGAWQILRGLRTLPIKMRAVAETADKVAGWVRNQPWVNETIHLGFDDYPQKDLRDKQMKGWSGLFSFIPKDQEQKQAIAFLESLKLFQIGVSWGGHESLAVTMPYTSILRPDTIQIIRLYCGLEHPDDLIRDLEQAAKKVGWI